MDTKPSIDQIYIGQSDFEVARKDILTLPIQTFKYSPPNPVYAMAYGGNKEMSNAVDIEVRLQRIERGERIIRRGRVIVTVPQFKSQSFISQTSANNPFVEHKIGTISIPSGQFPDTVVPSANSQIRYPNAPDL